MSKLSDIFRMLLPGLAASLFGCGSLTSESQWVYVNAVDDLGAIRCRWSGSQAFYVMDDRITMQFRVLPYGPGPNSYILTVSATAAPGISLETDSIRIGLVASSESGHEHRFALSPARPPLVGERMSVGERTERESWFQEFSVSPELVDKEGVTYVLVVDVAYQDAAGEQGQLSGRIPLRRVKIVIPTSLV